jgi:hypothetical protein
VDLRTNAQTLQNVKRKNYSKPCPLCLPERDMFLPGEHLVTERNTGQNCRELAWAPRQVRDRAESIHLSTGVWKLPCHGTSQGEDQSCVGIEQQRGLRQVRQTSILVLQKAFSALTPKGPLGKAMDLLNPRMQRPLVEVAPDCVRWASLSVGLIC